MINCEHKNKAFSSLGMTLTSNPPVNISYWICKDCGIEGEDRQTQPDLDADYNKTKAKFAPLKELKD